MCNQGLYIGMNKDVLEAYLTGLDVTFMSQEDSETKCDGSEPCVLTISGIEDGEYSDTQLSTVIVKYTYCKAVINDE